VNINLSTNININNNMNAENAYKPQISINNPNDNLLRKALELRSNASALPIDIQPDNRLTFNKPVINKEKPLNNINNDNKQQIIFDITNLPK